MAKKKRTCLSTLGDRSSDGRGLADVGEGNTTTSAAPSGPGLFYNNYMCASVNFRLVIEVTAAHLGEESRDDRAVQGEGDEEPRHHFVAVLCMYVCMYVCGGGGEHSVRTPRHTPHTHAIWGRGTVDINLAMLTVLHECVELEGQALLTLYQSPVM